MLDTSPLIEKLYDAVLDFDLWPDAIHDVATTLGGGGGSALLSKGSPGIWVKFDPDARALFEKQFVERNPYSAYVGRARRRGQHKSAITTDHDVCADLDIRRTEYFNEYLLPFDFVSSLVIDLAVGEKTAALNIARTAKQGSFEASHIAAAKTIRPHIARAFWLSMKLAEKAQFGDGIFQGLEQASFGVLLLDSAGRVTYTNSMADSILRERNGLRCESRALSACRSDTTATLHKLIAEAVATEGSKRGGSCSIRRPSGLPLSVTVVPLRGGRRLLFEASPSAIVCVFDPAASAAVSPKHLRELFGLSPAEARVAVKLLDGLDQKEIAAALGISFFTVRAHLSQIYQKSNTNRQAEFVSLAMRSINPVFFRNLQ